MVKRILGCIVLALTCYAADRVYVDGSAGVAGLTPEQLDKLTNAVTGSELAQALDGVKDRAGSWLVVDKNGKGDFTTITDALAAADAVHATNATQVVYIYIIPSSSYAEDITVNNRTALVGSRRSQITGKITVTGAVTGVWFIGLQIFNSDATRQHALHIDNATGGNVELWDCCLQDTTSRNSATAPILFDNSSVYLVLRNVEMQVKNHNSGGAAKNIAIKAVNTTRTGYIITLMGELKVTSGGGVAKNEYPIWADGKVYTELHGTLVNQVHDKIPRVYLNNGAKLWWMDSSFNASASAEYGTSTTWEIVNEGNTPNAIYWYAKEVGNFKAHHDAVFEEDVILRGGGVTNVINGVGVSNAVTAVVSTWPGTGADTDIARLSDLRAPYLPLTHTLVPAGGVATISSAYGAVIKLDVQETISLRVGDDFNPAGISMFMLAIKANGHEIDMADPNVNYHDNVDVFDDRWAILHFTKAFGDKWTAIQLNPGE